jgi:hypothetical protein
MIVLMGYFFLPFSALLSRRLPTLTSSNRLASAIIRNMSGYDASPRAKSSHTLRPAKQATIQKTREGGAEEHHVPACRDTTTLQGWSCRGNMEQLSYVDRHQQRVQGYEVGWEGGVGG